MDTIQINYTPFQLYTNDKLESILYSVENKVTLDVINWENGTSKKHLFDGLIVDVLASGNIIFLTTSSEHPSYIYKTYISIDGGETWDLSLLSAEKILYFNATETAIDFLWYKSTGGVYKSSYEIESGYVINDGEIVQMKTGKLIEPTVLKSNKDNLYLSATVYYKNNLTPIFYKSTEGLFNKVEIIPQIKPNGSTIFNLWEDDENYSILHSGGVSIIPINYIAAKRNKRTGKIENADSYTPSIFYPGKWDAKYDKVVYGKKEGEKFTVWVQGNVKNDSLVKYVADPNITTQKKVLGIFKVPESTSFNVQEVLEKNKFVHIKWVWFSLWVGNTKNIFGINSQKTLFKKSI